MSSSTTAFVFEDEPGLPSAVDNIMQSTRNIILRPSHQESGCLPLKPKCSSQLFSISGQAVALAQDVMRLRLHPLRIDGSAAD
eukprot:scaffold194091_cov18-Prasinocladus_malaysianus.AAC.1